MFFALEIDPLEFVSAFVGDECAGGGFAS